MILKIIGWVILGIGILGMIQSLISFYAESQIMKDFESMRESEKKMFLDKKKEIIKMRRISVVLLIIGILLVSKVFS